MVCIDGGGWAVPGVITPARWFTISAVLQDAIKLGSATTEPTNSLRLVIFVADAKRLVVTSRQQFESTGSAGRT